MAARSAPDVAIPTEPSKAFRGRWFLSKQHAYSNPDASRKQSSIHVTNLLFKDTVTRLESIGSPVVTNGEQGKESFVTYPIRGLNNIAARTEFRFHSRMAGTRCVSLQHWRQIDPAAILT
jgi:hypothetical protein